VERLAGAPCPIAVAPHGYSRPGEPIRTIAVAYDESPEAQRALELAPLIARRDGLTMRIVAVSATGDDALQSRPEEAAARLGSAPKATAR
jgi:hypothetical protein